MSFITNKENYFLSQPHQPFFILAITNSIIMMLIFAFSYKGLILLNMDILNFHVYSLVFLVFTNVFTGFLFTTFPRFCQSEVIKKSYYINIFLINSIASFVLIGALFLSHYIVIPSMFVLFTTQIFIVLKLYTIYKNGKMQVKEDPYWILIAQYFGLLGHGLFIFLELNKYLNLDVNIFGLAISVSFYMYVIFLGFSVAQRMIPFFSHSFEDKSKNFIKIVFSMFILKILFIQNDIKIAQILIDVLLSAYLLKEFISWKLPIFSSPAILWVLHLALFWLPVSFAVSALSLSAELLLDVSMYYLNIHLLAIGFLTTVLIGFGTRVTLGHGGQSPHADKFVTGLFWFIQVVVLLRVLVSLNIAFSWNLNFFFDISFTAWVVLFALWAFRYAKILVFGSKV